MALTRLKTSSDYNFIQPNVGEIVFIQSDSHIDWLTENAIIHIPNGGIYKIISIAVFTLEIELVKAITPVGEGVVSNIIYPIAGGNVEEPITNTDGIIGLDYNEDFDVDNGKLKIKDIGYSPFQTYLNNKI